MRAPKVEIAGGEGFDLLVSAVAVADPDWRDVMAHGAAVWSTVRHDAGAETARQAARFGRFGWINLIGLLAAHPGRGGRDDLVALVDGTPADELRFVVAGGRREQLRERLGAERLRDALAGDATAARELSRALATPGMLLDVTDVDPAYLGPRAQGDAAAAARRVAGPAGRAAARRARAMRGGGSARSVRRRSSPR